MSKITKSGTAQPTGPITVAAEMIAESIHLLDEIEEVEFDLRRQVDAQPKASLALQRAVPDTANDEFLKRIQAWERAALSSKPVNNNELLLVMLITSAKLDLNDGRWSEIPSVEMKAEAMEDHGDAKTGIDLLIQHLFSQDASLPERLVRYYGFASSAQIGIQIPNDRAGIVRFRKYWSDEIARRAEGDA